VTVRQRTPPQLKEDDLLYLMGPGMQVGTGLQEVGLQEGLVI
jgi:hypothetical protein